VHYSESGEGKAEKVHRCALASVRNLVITDDLSQYKGPDIGDVEAHVTLAMHPAIMMQGSK